MSAKHRAMAFSGFTPGPDGAAVVGSNPPPAPTYLSHRITTGLDMAAPTQQFTPTQQFFRDSLASGRFQSDSPVNSAVTRITQDPTTGAVDAVRMEPVSVDGGPDYYADLGGKGGVDYAARRP